jgi:hypothetical protein
MLLLLTVTENSKYTTISAYLGVHFVTGTLVRHTAYRDTNKYTERGVTKCHLDTDV